MVYKLAFMQVTLVLKYMEKNNIGILDEVLSTIGYNKYMKKLEFRG